VEISKETSPNQQAKVSLDHPLEEETTQFPFIKPQNLKSIPCKMSDQPSSIGRFKHKT